MTDDFSTFLKAFAAMHPDDQQRLIHVHGQITAHMNNSEVRRKTKAAMRAGLMEAEAESSTTGD